MIDSPDPDPRVPLWLHEDRLDEVREQRDRARRLSAWAVAVAVVAVVLMLVVSGNSLESSAYGATVKRGATDVRAERLLSAWCPASMPRRHCVAWMRVAQCETGDPRDRGVTYRSLRKIRWRYDGASGYDGALQFSPRTWRGNIGRVPARRLTRAQWVARERGVYRLAHGAPPAVQILTADALRVRRDGGGLGHWPSCGGRWRG